MDELRRRGRRGARHRGQEGEGGCVQGQEVGVEERDGDERGGEQGLDGEGDDGRQAVVRAEERSGFDERFFEHDGTSMCCFDRCIQARNAVVGLDTGGGGDVPVM